MIVADGHYKGADGFITAHHTEFHHGSAPFFLIETTQFSHNLFHGFGVWICHGC
jgi:hypothetical protein